MTHSDIIRLAYRVTVSYPGLWLLGIFLATGFNIQLLFFGSAGNPVVEIGRDGYAYLTGDFFRSGILPIASFLCFFIFGLVATNLAKVLLVQRLQLILDSLGLDTFLPEENGQAPRTLERVRGREVIPHWTKAAGSQARNVVFRVVAISLFTTALMFFVIAVLSFPFVSFAKRQAADGFMWMSAGLLLAGSAFVISILGMFASFFVVLFRVRSKAAINLAVDLITTRWQEIAGTVLAVGVVYLGLFFAGSYVVVGLERVLGLYDRGVALLLRNVLLWGWLSVLNVFFYTAMLVFFVQLISPKKTEEQAGVLVNHAPASEL